MAKLSEKQQQFVREYLIDFNATQAAIRAGYSEKTAAQTAALAGIKQGANGIEVKLHDKVRALELLGKAVGLFDKTEGSQQGIEDLTPLVELLKDD